MLSYCFSLLPLSYIQFFQIIRPEECSHVPTLQIAGSSPSPPRFCSETSASHIARSIPQEAQVSDLCEVCSLCFPNLPRIPINSTPCSSQSFRCLLGQHSTKWLERMEEPMGCKPISRAFAPAEHEGEILWIGFRVFLNDFSIGMSVREMQKKHRTEFLPWTNSCFGWIIRYTSCTS